MGALMPEGIKKPISVRVPESLLEEIGELKARARRLRMAVSMPKLVIDGLIAEIANTRETLDRLEGGASVPRRVAVAPVSTPTSRPADAGVEKKAVVAAPAVVENATGDLVRDLEAGGGVLADWA